MMNRREALVAIGAAAFTASGEEIQKPAGDTLSADLTRLESRVYSEEGIPMFLACENVGLRNSQSPTALNKRVAGSFQRYADGWQRLHPDAPASDVNRIVEFLADEDFAKGGTERGL